MVRCQASAAAGLGSLLLRWSTARLRTLPFRCGRYLGGKIEIPVGDTTVWAQMGVNVVIPGSNAWKA